MDNVKIILAKFWVSILCGVIVLVSLIASYWPLGGYHDEIQTKLKASVASFDKIQALQNKPRKLPTLPGQQEGADLKTFPSESIITAGGKIRDDLEVESTKAVDAVVTINRHDQLVPGVLPNPQSTGPLDFRKAYIDRIGPGGSLQAKLLQAGYPPSKEAIDTEKKRLLKEVYEPKIYRDASGTPMNEQMVKDEYEAAMLKVPADMQQATAAGCKVYLNPDAITIDPTVANVNLFPPDPKTIWWAQLALWCQQDVATAIADANKDAKNVTDAPIKRIWKIELPQIGPTLLFIGKGAPIAAGSGAANDPNAGALLPPADPNALVTGDTRLSPTGRVCNGMYDVIQFRLELTVSFKDLPMVLETLSRGRLITVLNVESITTEDAIAAQDKDGFMYGPDPVVRVSLRCEDLFLRSWTTPLMPDLIKKMLGVPPPAAPGT